MNIFSRFKNNIEDWATGNYHDYTSENEVYKEIQELTNRLEDNLEIVISKSTLFDTWATFEFGGITYTLPILKNLIEAKLKDYTLNPQKNTQDEFKEIEFLQEQYKKIEPKIKSKITKNCFGKEEMEEIYWILVEIKRKIKSYANLEAIKKSNLVNQDSLDYEEIQFLKRCISERKCVIIPYIDKMDYNKKK